MDHASATAAPPLWFDVAELVARVRGLLDEAAAAKNRKAFGPVNWAGLKVADIEVRTSVLHPDYGTWAICTVEEAEPNGALAEWLNDRVDDERFPRVYVECEW